MARLVNERDLLHRANLAGYTLVNFELNGHRSSLTINCPACGTTRTVNYTRFKYKSKCLVCLANNNRLSKNDILTVINRLGYEILSFGEGQGQKQQLAVRCTTCGKQREVTYKAVISKPVCKHLVAKAPKEKQPRPKLALEQRNGYKTTLSKLPVGYTFETYVVGEKPLIRCDKGHVTRKSQKRWTRGNYYCDVCEEYDRINTHLSGLGYQLLSLQDTAHYQCQLCNKPQRKAIKALSSVRRCTWCSRDRRKQAVFDRRVSRLRAHRYTVETPGTIDRNRDLRIWLTCPAGHRRKTNVRQIYDTPDGLLASFCDQCYPENRHSSIPERQIVDWLGSLGHEVVRWHKTGRYELDVYLPRFHLAIEHHGMYYHSFIPGAKSSLRWRHHAKMVEAQRSGIQLLQIWSDEWAQKSDIVKSMILAKLGMTTKIHARKCQILPVTKQDAKEFYREHHLHGDSINTLESWGLYHDEQLVACASASNHRSDGVVLGRLCFAKGVSVVGGASRLLAKFPKPIMTWSDNRYADDGVYRKLGFELVREHKPDYQYITTSCRKRIRKQVLKRSLAERGSGKTEFELRAKQGYRLLYDAGKKQWVLH